MSAGRAQTLTTLCVTVLPPPLSCTHAHMTVLGAALSHINQFFQQYRLGQLRARDPGMCCCDLNYHFMHACLPSCLQACMPACIPACLHACLHIHKHTCIRMHTHAYACIHMHTHAYTCIHMKSYADIYAYIKRNEMRQDHAKSLQS